MNHPVFVVLVDDKVVFRCDTASAAAAFCDGLGAGLVAEVLSKAQEKPRQQRGSRKPKASRKPEKT